MATPKNPLRFIPLNTASQASHQNVLYYNANASPDAIYQCATMKLQAAINLLEVLGELKDTPYTILRTISLAITLLNHSHILIEELNPVALELRGKVEKE